jgi:enoyl-CoA hydratase
MRYLLTGDYWDAQTAYRMGVVQEVAPDKDAALKIGVDIANRIAACGPFGVKATLAAAHLAINDAADAAAYAKLEEGIREAFRFGGFSRGAQSRS